MKNSIGAKTIVYPTPVFIVGTYDKDERPNAMAVAWGGICCSAPPCVAISVREATYTYGNLMNNKAFTISIPSEKHVKEADHCGIATGRKENKFETCKLKAVKSALVNAPYVDEFPLVLECKVIKDVNIGLHTQFIGEILDVKADEAVLTELGVPDITKIKPFIFDPSNRNYYGIGDIIGQAFAIGKDI